MVRSLPVLMYHYVSRFTGPINVTPDVFEAQCKGMAEAGWRGVGLAEAEAWLLEKRPLPKKSVFITFDDGFLDNYVYAAPILERYGHQGVVFAVTERMEHGVRARPSVRDVWEGRLERTELPPVDMPMAEHALGYHYRNDIFMNWPEARALDSDGVLAVAAHTARHTAVFASASFPPHTDSSDSGAPEYAARRFHTPGRRGNTFYRIEGDVPWGLPRFAEQPAMGGPAFIPSAKFLDAIRELVPQEKKQAFEFFQSPANVERLCRLVDAFPVGEMGRMETEDEARARMAADLSLCAATLERELGHGVVSLCWPWGRGSDMAREEAAKLGFSVFYETRPGANRAGEARAVRRFKVRNKPWPWLGLRLFTYSRPLLAAVYGALKK